MGAKKGSYLKVGENLYRYSTSKIYFASFRHNGKMVWKNLRTTDRELAKRFLKDEMEKAGKVDPEQASLTFGQLLDLYQESLQQFDTKTSASRKCFLNKLKATWPHGFDLPVGCITPAQLELWLAPHRQRMKKVSFNEYIRVVKHVFELALNSKAIAESPAAKFKFLRKEEPVRLTPSAQQFESIVQFIRENRFSDHAEDTSDLVQFMGIAGVGMAECGNLLGEHIDFERSQIRLYRSKTDTGYVIPIFPQVRPFLNRLKAEGRIKNGCRVFAVHDPKKALIAACKRLNYPQFTSRSLRRFFITRAIELGVDFKTISAWQGHRDGGVLIARTYSNLRSEHSDNMASKIAGLEKIEPNGGRAASVRPERELPANP
jgi:integrase